MKQNQNDKCGTRFVKGRKQEALAQIEGWVGGSREELIKAGAAKVASHPPKNITEQKMLDSHLYDMSRQRFSFLVQCQWERKLFLEKQKRKTAVMHDLLRNVDLSGIPENPFITNRSKKEPVDKKRKLRPLLDKDDVNLNANSDQLDSRSLAADVFVTHNFVRSKGSHSIISAVQDENQTKSCDSRALSWSTNTGKRQTWPLNDLRYTQLNDVLCDTYPKSSHLLSRKTRSVTENIRY